MRWNVGDMRVEAFYCVHTHTHTTKSQIRIQSERNETNVPRVSIETGKKRTHRCSIMWAGATDADRRFTFSYPGTQAGKVLVLALVLSLILNGMEFVVESEKTFFQEKFRSRSQFWDICLSNFSGFSPDSSQTNAIPILFLSLLHPQSPPSLILSHLNLCK